MEVTVMYEIREPLFSIEVNWSLFNYGITLPVRYNDIFGKGEDGHLLKKGEDKKVRILLNGGVYYGRITNVNFQKRDIRATTLQLRYSKNSDLAKKLKEIYKESYEYILKERKNRNSGGIIRLPDDRKEYLYIYDTEYFDIYWMDSSKIDTKKGINLQNNSTDTDLRWTQDIRTLTDNINYSQNMERHWKRQIIDYHNLWKERKETIHPLREVNTLWGRQISINPDLKIKDIFKEGVDGSIVELFKSINKEYISEIEDRDLIRFIYQDDLNFFQFKRIIDKIFVKESDKSLNIEWEGDKDKASNIEKYAGKKTNEPDITQEDLATEKKLSTIQSMIGISLNEIANNLKLLDSMEKEHTELITRLKKKIKEKDKIIKEQTEYIKQLEVDLESYKKNHGEIKNIKRGLLEIKELFNKEDLF